MEVRCGQFIALARCGAAPIVRPALAGHRAERLGLGNRRSHAPTWAARSPTRYAPSGASDWIGRNAPPPSGELADAVLGDRYDAAQLAGSTPTASGQGTKLGPPIGSPRRRVGGGVAGAGESSQVI